MEPNLERQIMLGLVQLRADALARGALLDALLGRLAKNSGNPGTFLEVLRDEVLAGIVHARQASEDPSEQITLRQAADETKRAVGEVARVIGVTLKPPSA